MPEPALRCSANVAGTTPPLTSTIEKKITVSCWDLKHFEYVETSVKCFK